MIFFDALPISSAARQFGLLAFKLAVRVARCTEHRILLALWATLLAGIRTPALAAAPARGNDRLPPPSTTTVAAGANPGAPAAPAIYITEYRIEGAQSVPKAEIEEAVYPFLGPERTEDDVENARKALEKLYRDKGMQAVDVQVPEQNPALLRRGIVSIQVAEGVVGRLRVKGAHYFLPSAIRHAVPSLAEGRVVDFNRITKELLALNRQADRKVTPSMTPGTDPGTMDVDLKVEDTSPLHGSVEFNNRYNQNTTPWRVNASLSYANLWQLGHVIGGSVQLAPERIKDASVYSAYYLAPVPSVDGLSLMVQGTKQNSDVASIGSLDSIGRGEAIGARAILTLPQTASLQHSVSFGFDYKHYEATDVTVSSSNGVIPTAPVTYYPISAAYTATWTGKRWSTDLDATVTFSIRGTGHADSTTSAPTAFDNIRYKADDNFITLRGGIAHTHDLPAGFQAFARVEGQIASGPLVPGEQFSAGGLDSVRGYLESTALGDDGFAGSAELRTPSAGTLFHLAAINEWRLFVFFDGAVLKVRNALPEQQSTFELAAYGAGARFRIFNHFDGLFALGIPLIGQGATQVHDPLFTFRVRGDF